MPYSFKEYNLDENNPDWKLLKENSFAKITYQDNLDFCESFWVWIEKIKEDEITGIITNNLLSKSLKIGKKINFNKNNIKEFSKNSLTYDEIMENIKKDKREKYIQFIRTLTSINI